MARIHSIKIDNYRGIKHLEQMFGDENLVVLIGRGDTGKSTLLHAIQAVLCPYWNLSFSDMDFFSMDIEEPITIEATMADVPQELLTMEKFGNYYCLLRDGNVVTDITSEDANQDEIVLTIKMVVDKSLEPKWYVTSGRDEQQDIAISANDRAKFCVFMIADYVDNHFSYNRTSPLYTLFRNTLGNDASPSQKLIELRRKISEVIMGADDLEEFDAVVRDIIKDANKWGLELHDLKTSFDVIERSYTESNISLHNEKLPYRLHGKGAKHLLSMAIQSELTKTGGIVLIDEIEQGLESDRIVNLVHTFKNNRQGQIFITTHSKSALVEADAHNLFMMRSGCDKLIHFDGNSQGLLRSQPEAFFAKKIICCEGKTEEGVLRAINDFIQKRCDTTFAAKGVVIANCEGGTKVITQSLALRKAGFDVCSFLDADDKEVMKKLGELKKANIPLAICEDGKCIEQQVFNDISWTMLIELVKMAASLNEKNTSRSLKKETVDALPNITDIDEQKEKRELYGNEAGQNSWFKNIEKGAAFGKLIIEAYDGLDANCKLKEELDIIAKWIGVTFSQPPKD